MAEYILDLRLVKLPDWWPKDVPREIPMRDGEWERDFDVIEDRVPGFRGSMRLAVKKRFPGMYENRSRIMPFGLDRNQMPKGAILRTLNE